MIRALVFTASVKQIVAAAHNDTSSTSSSYVVSTTPTSSVDYQCLHKNNWIIESHYNSIFKTMTGPQSLTYSASQEQSTVAFSSIVNYERAFTAADIAELNSRPSASTDFKSGATTAVAGHTYEFGANIGYLSDACALGYWPAGPVCPTSTTYTQSYPTQPKAETSSSGCFTSFTYPLAILVNGEMMYSWSDANTYLSYGYWHNLAASFEQYDFDVCSGHSAMGIYHCHAYPNCLAESLGDDGSGHSPVYGFAIDGYPIYGPYQSKGVLAKSCFAKRDYSKTSPTGCSDGARSCVLKTIYDYSQGTTTLYSKYSGPSLTGNVTTQSDHTISAASGIYFEDYYYDSSCYKGLGTADDYTLNQNNGHDHDGLGFHYHATVDSSMTPTFPYSAGPKFYGCIANSVAIDEMSGKTSTPACWASYTGSGSGKSTCASSSYGTSSTSCSN
jgi:hypothetical protein